MILDDDVYWHTRDGRSIKYCDMEMSHIGNTLSIMLRKAKNLALIAAIEAESMMPDNASDGVFWGLTSYANDCMSDPEGYVRSTKAYQRLIEAAEAKC